MSDYPRHRFIESYSHQGRIGVLVELGLETRAITADPRFRAFATALAMHVAAMSPKDAGDLLGQQFVKNPGQTVQAALAEASARLKERIAVMRLVRWDHDQNASPPQSPVPTPPRIPAMIRRVAERKK